MSQIRRDITARELLGALSADGFVLSGTRGSHRIYRHPDGRRVIVAYHRLRSTFPLATLTAMITDAEWTEEDLRRLGILRQ